MLKPPGHDEGDVQLTKRQYVHNNTATTVTTTTTTTIIMTPTTTKANDMKVKILGNIEGKVELNQNTPCACRLSKCTP